MGKMLSITGIGLLASALAGTLALAQKPMDTGAGGNALGDIEVSATRSKATASTVGWPKAPVQQITLSYAVSPSNFDLSTTAGEAGLEKLVNTTAVDVCNEIGRQYPDVKPDNGACAKAAAAKAMVKVHELVAVASKKGTK
jgi:UrcA family protein